MATMKAVRFHRTGPPEVLVYETVDRPEPAPGYVQARVEVIGVNYAQIMRRKGVKYPVPTVMPFIPGGEAVGVIEAVGSGVDTSLIGTRAILYPSNSGCYAEYIVAPTNRVYPLPTGTTPSQAMALFVQGLTAAFVLRESARIQPSETVFVQAAAGGVGCMAVQLAKAYGAGLVIGAASTEAKRKLVRELGADLAVDYGQPGWNDVVHRFTNGRGVDIVFEVTGGEVARQSMKLLAPFGRSVVFGGTSEENWLVDTQELPPGNYSITGFWLKQYLDRRQLIIDTLNEFSAFMRAGRLQVLIGGTYPLSQACVAHADIEGRRTSGKIILVPDSMM